MSLPRKHTIFTRKKVRRKMEKNREELMVKCAVDAILDKKGYNVKSLFVGKVTSITDYFVLASGSNVNQIDAIVDSVEEAMKKADYELKIREGKPQGGWVLLDYGDIVVHLFTSEMREFYDLDNTWRDVEKIEY